MSSLDCHKSVDGGSQDRSVSRSGHLFLGDVRVAAGGEWEFRAQKLGTWYLIRIAAGIGYRQSEKGYQEIATDDVMLVFPSAAVSFLASRLTDSHLQMCAIDLGLLSGVFSMDESRALAGFASQHGKSVMYFPKSHPFAVRFVEICKSPRANGLSSRLHLLQLFTELVGDGLKLEMAPMPVHHDGRTRLRELIREMPEAELIRSSVGDLSKRLCFSDRHFSRLFREELGVSLRERQQFPKLEKAKHLLESSNEKIINIAMEVGYQSLSLFNVMFKKRYQMTPTQWRIRSLESKRRPKPGRSLQGPSSMMGMLAAAFACLEFISGSGVLAQDSKPPETTTPPPAAATSGSASPTNSTPKFPIRSYDVRGNTLLSVSVIESIFQPYQGNEVDLAAVKKALGELTLAYRDRGYVTVGVSLPPQRITNGVVIVQVTEGILSEVVVLGNRYYSSNNVRRALPSLQTNGLLNSKVLQAELDVANSSRDRQIYPQIQPGAEPGTSTLLLKVKDRLPLHGRLEVNNHKTPGTPDLRVNSNLQYNNLWQREHSLSFQYGFSPEKYKEDRSDRSIPFYDRPLIGYYNMSYRMPLHGMSSVGDRIDENPGEFGYNAATRQFVLPPIASVPELTFFGNRSTTDTGVVSTKPVVVTQTPVTTIESRDVSRDLSTTEGMGFRYSMPLLTGRQRLGLSVGLDFKNYDSTTYRTNMFDQTSVIPAPNPNDPPQVIRGSTGSGRRGDSGLTYLPLSLRLEGVIPDKRGSTLGSLGLTYNFAEGGPFSKDQDFQASTGNSTGDAQFMAVTASVMREQVFEGDWRLLLKADGQWAPQPLFSNEQYAAGGMGAPRGYVQGDEFGDLGWRVTAEPRTPSYNIGLVDGKVPAFMRFSAFVDYARTYLLEPQGRRGQTSMLGLGGGMNITFGRTVDMAVVAAWPLLSSKYSRPGTGRIYFSVAMQF